MATGQGSPSNGFGGPRMWGAVVAVWTAVALLVATQVYLRTLATPDPIPWWPLVLFELLYWYSWALVTPLIFALGSRLPLDRGRRARNLVVHAAIGVALGLVLTAWFAALAKGFASEGQPDYALSFGAAFLKYMGIGFHTDLLLYWAVLGAGWALRYAELYRERERRAAELQTRLVQARLDALRLQLQPHFLFNTLHAISTLMDEDVRTARRMIARLSELLRLALDKGDRHEVSLQEELELLDCYLEIEAVRFQDRLVVQREVDPATLRAEVPILILQPLVENAIRHGIAREERAGKIEIRSARHNGRLQLEVADDGPGIREERLEALDAGIGLSNIRGRLAQLYGDAARVVLENLKGGGLRVQLELPFRDAAPRPERMGPA